MPNTTSTPTRSSAMTSAWAPVTLGLGAGGVAGVVSGWGPPAVAADAAGAAGAVGAVGAAAAGCGAPAGWAGGAGRGGAALGAAGLAGMSSGEGPGWDLPGG